MIKVGDKVAYDVAWNVQYGEVVTIKRSLFGTAKQLLIHLENETSKNKFDIVPESLCMKLTGEEYERLKELSKKNGRKK
jgi:hypothetical protein